MLSHVNLKFFIWKVVNSIFFNVNLKLLIWKYVNLSCNILKLQIERCKF
jgi:hypothetical protein